MRIAEVKVYGFNELSDKAKEKVCDHVRSHWDYPWHSDNQKSLDEFTRIFPVKIKDYEYGCDRGYISFDFVADEAIEDLCGIRLLKFLWNNYKQDLYKGKYYHVPISNRVIHHKRVVSKQLQNGNVHNGYYSAITLKCECPLTGYYMDDELIDPIMKFMKNPTDMSFKDLMRKCLYSWVNACDADVDHYFSDESIAEMLEANDYEFTEDGGFFQ